MLYAILYFIGALCFWMWDYEANETGWKTWARPAVWPVITIWRAAREAYWRMGNKLIETRLRREEQEWWDTRIGDIEDDPIMREVEPEEGEDTLEMLVRHHNEPEVTTVKRQDDPVYQYEGDDFVTELVTKQIERRDEKAKLEELRAKALGYIEYDDGAIVFLEGEE